MGAGSSRDERVREAGSISSALAPLRVASQRPSGAGIAFALLLLACQAAPTSPLPPDDDAGVCENLAYVFRLVAQERDRGTSKKDQIEMMRESVDSPFVTRPEQTLRQLLHVVDLVYRHSDSSAREIEAIVIDGCTVDEQGRAVLKMEWPAP
jgi:hypothetical protein